MMTFLCVMPNNKRVEYALNAESNWKPLKLLLVNELLLYWFQELLDFSRASGLWERYTADDRW